MRVSLKADVVEAEHFIDGSDAQSDFFVADTRGFMRSKGQSVWRSLPARRDPC